MDLYDMMQKGGVLMWPILLCALLTVYVLVDRMVVLRRARMDATQFMLKLKSIYRHADLNAVLSYCSQKEAPIVAVVRRGMTKMSDGDMKIREAMEGAGREELYRLERRLTTLASISGIAPMLGFLGAVIGMVKAFNAIAPGSGTLTAAVLGSGIYEALLAMGFGLCVGIVALVSYNYLLTRVGRIAHDMEITAGEFLDMVDQGPAGFQATTTRGDEGPPLSKPMLQAEPEFFRRKVT
jgi:biopolymer transport protein ExbB